MGEGFVGRAEELAAIEALLAETRRAHAPAALLLIGEPGIGKSRVLAEAEEGHSGAAILRFAGYEPEATVPLAAAAPLLRRIASASEDRTLLGLLSADPGAGALDQIRIFESAHRQLSHLKPAGLFIDDLQWVDPVSLALCHFLVRAADGASRGLAFVLASRPSSVADAFAASLGTTLAEGQRCAVVRLRPLDQAAGIRFITDRVGAIDRQVALDLWDRAGGSPFWLDVLVHAGDHEGDVAEVVAARIAAVDPDGRHVLTLLAILGRPSDPIELERFVGWPAERTTSAIAGLVRRGLAIDDTSTRIAHDLIRDVVVGRTEPVARRRLHASIAEVLERDGATDAAGSLAVLEHRAAAGTFDADLALRILVSDQRRLIGSDGVRRISRAAGQLEDTATRVRVDQAAATLADELGDQALALELWSSVTRTTTDDGIAARAEFGAAVACYHLGRGAEARRWLAASRARQARTSELEIARDALEARILLWLEHRTGEGRRLAMRAVARGRSALAAADVDDSVRVAHFDALIAGWEAAIQDEQVDAVLELADESLGAARWIGLREEIEARSMIGMALEYAADQREAVTTYRGVWDDAWRAVLPVEAVDVGYRLASVLVDVLDVREAARIAAETERLAARVGDQGRVRDRTRLVPYQVAMLTSDWQPAIVSILAEGAEEPDPHYGLRYPLAVAVWFARLGIRGDEAVRHADEARRLAVAAGCVACGRDTDLAIAEVFARFDRWADARAALDRWDAVGRRSWVESEWQRRRLAILVEDEPAADRDGLEAVLTGLRDDADREAFGLNALWAELDMGRLLARRDRAASVAAYRRAAQRADASGAPTLRRLADQGLRMLGERPWRRGPSRAASGLAALSDREREVAGLVADGATNVDIAARLFLSRKTVEHHVSNALSKLGLRSRAELAAVVGRETHPVDTDGASPP